MIDLADLEIRYAAHTTRIERTNREGWRRAKPTAGRRTGASPVGAVIAQVDRFRLPTRLAGRLDATRA